MNLRKRDSRTTQDLTSAQKKQRARSGKKPELKNSVYNTLNTHARKHHHRIYFHECCVAFGYGSTVDNYGHRQKEQLNWATWTEQNRIRSQEDLESWLINQSTPLHLFPVETALKVHVYCDARKRQLMSMSPSQLVDLVLKLEEQASSDSSEEAANQSTSKQDRNTHEVKDWDRLSNLDQVIPTKELSPSKKELQDTPLRICSLPALNIKPP